ncbi:MAG: hypothetical protein ACKO1J_10550, partial [Tagaea sp.]
HLVVRRRNRPDTESHVVIVGPGGGLVAVGFTHFYEPELKRRQWRIDPFAFLAAALGHTGGPAPDVTTLTGRRIFFSHIDGDADGPYLVESRWPVRGLARGADGFAFSTGGFGAGEMVWRVAPNSRWRVARAGGADIEAQADSGGTLRVDLGFGRGREIAVRFSRRDG